MKKEQVPNDTPIPLSPAVLLSTLPFHLLLTREMKIWQTGSCLAKIAKDATPGANFGVLFSWDKTHHGPVDPAILPANEGKSLLIHKKSGIRMWGQFVELKDSGGWLFAGSPWFESTSAILAAGLTLGDIAAHISIDAILALSDSTLSVHKSLISLESRHAKLGAEFDKLESLYAAAIAAADAVPYRLDFATGRYSYLGNGVQDLTGFAPADLTPDAMRNLVVGSKSHSQRDAIADGSMNMNGRLQSEYKIKTRLGGIRWISDSSVPVANDNGEIVGVVGILKDVTRRVEATQKLRESEERAHRLALVAANTHSAVTLIDARGKSTWVNEGFTRLTGFTLTEIQHKPSLELLVGPLTNASALARVEQEIQSGKAATEELQLYRNDGSAYWADVEIQPIGGKFGELDGYMCIQTDTTARRRSEEKLSQLSAELDIILGLIPGGVIAFNANDEVIYCNAGFEALTGLGAHLFVGKKYEEFDALFAERCLSGQSGSYSAKLANASTDVINISWPHQRVVARSAAEIRDSAGVCCWRVLYLRDITREANLEKEKNEFFSMAAHELRTPMSSVHGFSELLMSQSYDADTTKKLAATIHKQSGLLVSIVNELLDLARIESGRGNDMEILAHSVGEIVAETVSGLKVSGDGRQVDMSAVTSNPRMILADAKSLKLALTNVLSNSYKYSHKSSVIRVLLKERSWEATQQLGICVADTGIGMSPSEVAHIFDRFYRANPSAEIQGTGLGMAIVKEVIVAMGGAVDVKSESGIGTEVTLWLSAAAS